MADKPVVWKKENGICFITMNEATSLNAINRGIIIGLEEAFEDCYDDDIRAIVLTGAGRAFCAGGDLAEMIKDGPAHWLLQEPKKLGIVVSIMRKMPKPIIASINGPAFGVGMSVAMACDLRIMSEKATFAQAYTSVGLSPDGAWSMTVPQTVGVAKALEMVLLDRPINAEDALRLGLVSIVVPPDQLEAETLKVATKLANGPTKAYAKAKALINRSMLDGIESQMDLERYSISDCGGSEDFVEGSDAIFNKRKPAFKGR